MRRTHLSPLAGTFALAATIGLSACAEQSQSDIQTVQSAVGTHASFIRSYTQANGNQAVIFRDNTGGITEVDPTFHSMGAHEDGGPPWGFRRSDNVNSVVYVANNQRIHELTPTSGQNNFVDNDFFNAPINAPLAAPSPGGGNPIPDVIGYIRSDNTNALVYRSSENHIIEVTSNFGHSPPWLVFDLTLVTGSGRTATKGSAFPYVRSDNKNAIVYIADDDHIHEIVSNFGSQPSWLDFDLYAHSGENVSPSTDPWPYVRADGQNAVVFVATDNKVHELLLNTATGCGAHPWCAGIITAAVSPSGGLSNRPSGYVRADSKSAVVYVSGSNSLHELLLTSSGWVDGTLPTDDFSPSQPFACRGPRKGAFSDCSGQFCLGQRSMVHYEGTKLLVRDGFTLSLTPGAQWRLVQYHACPGC